MAPWGPFLFVTNQSHMTTIRKLATFELQKYADHLKRLGSEDRYLRFASAVTDDNIQRYVDTQFRIKQTVLAVLDDDDNVVAAIELIFDQSRYSVTNETVEIGLSVQEGHRNKGLGTELFTRALLLARNRGAKTLISHCLRQNRWMMKIARKQAMNVYSEGADSVAELTLDPPNSSTIVGEVVGDGMALWDHTMKRMPLLFNYGAMSFLNFKQRKSNDQTS